VHIAFQKRFGCFEGVVVYLSRIWLFSVRFGLFKGWSRLFCLWLPGNPGMKALRTRNRTGRLCWSIRVGDEVATWVSERSMQSNSVTLLWANIADRIHRQHRHIGQYISVSRYIGRSPDEIILLVSWCVFPTDFGALHGCNLQLP